MIKTIASSWRIAAAFVVLAIPASAQLRNFGGYAAGSLAANDDGSTGLVNIGFSLNFFGTNYSQLYVNNNGNVTFDSALSTFTPFGLAGTNRVIIAPFFADVDTRAAGSNLVTYGSGLLGGRNALAVNYDHVGVFDALSIFNSFQLVIIDRSDTGAGNFDFEFNYGAINWETGQASGSNQFGLGGSSARIGFSNGGSNSYELPGSGINGYFLDQLFAGNVPPALGDNPNGLIYHSFGTPFDGAIVDGRYSFSVRNGVVEVPGGAVPEPSAYGVMGACMLLGAVVLRRRVSAVRA